VASSQVPAVDGALRLLRLLASRAVPISAATMSRELEIPRSSVYHLLTVLQQHGYVVHVPEGRVYGLGVAAFEMGSAYLRQEPLARLARPLLQRLTAVSRHTSHLGVLHGGETLYLVKEQPGRAVTLVTDVGVRLPAHLTASGRSMLAHQPAAQLRAMFPAGQPLVARTDRGPTDRAQLEALLHQERRRGWSEEEGHVTEGVASVACCSFDHGARPVAAISATFPSHRLDSPARDGLALLVQRAADRLTQRLSGRRPDDAGED
jgi:DNA-binding IclR family transcriptional regulator